jgi:hypothetical protein
MTQMIAMEPEPVHKGPLGDPRWPLFQVVGCKDRLICYAEIDEYGTPQLLSALPDLGREERRCTWLEWEVGEWGSLGAIMALNIEGDAPYSEEDWIWWCLREGLCPGQVIIVDITAEYTKDYIWDYACYEYDFNVDWEIISREHIPMAEHAERWVEVFEEIDKLCAERGEAPILRNWRDT